MGADADAVSGGVAKLNPTLITRSLASIILVEQIPSKGAHGLAVATRCVISASSLSYRNEPGMHNRTPETGSQSKISGGLASTVDVGADIELPTRRFPQICRETKHPTPHSNFLGNLPPETWPGDRCPGFVSGRRPEVSNLAPGRPASTFRFLTPGWASRSRYCLAGLCTGWGRCAAPEDGHGVNYLEGSRFHIQGGLCRQKHRYRNTASRIGSGG